MELERYTLDWQLDTSQKWLIDRTLPPPPATSSVAIGQSVEFDSGIIVVNSKPWAIGTHKPSTDTVRGFRITTLASRPTIRVVLTRAICLICEVGPVADNKFWIATQNGGNDFYDRDWKLGKGWIVHTVEGVSGIGPNNVLTFTASEADLQRGLLLLFAYSLGLAVPFLLAALMIERFMSLFQRYRGALLWMSRISGVLLITVGVLMLTGSMTVLSGWLQGLTPEFLKNRL